MEKQFRISKRALETVASPIRKFLLFADAAKKKGIRVYHLNIGQPDLETPKSFLENIKNFKENRIEYAPSAGLLRAREAWQKYYKNWNINLSIDEILIMTGGSEAMLFAFLALADFGDEAIIFEPLYSSYKMLATMTGVKIIPVTLKVENGFHLPSLAEIEAKISPRTKFIVVCNPNNPTGTVYNEDEMRTIVQLALKHNLFILSDETYREFVFAGERAISFLDFPEISDNVVVADSISKRFNSCGARIGALISRNKEIIANVLKFAQCRLSSPTLEQLGSIELLENSQGYTKSINEEYKKRKEVVFRALQSMEGVTCLEPEGAFYIIAKLPIENSEDFVLWLLKDFNLNGKTVMVTPAEDFYVTEGLGKNEVRIAYVLNTTDLVEAMEIFKKGLTEYKIKYK
jgi:aspartate aminotransferase